MTELYGYAIKKLQEEIKALHKVAREKDSREAWLDVESLDHQINVFKQEHDEYIHNKRISSMWTSFMKTVAGKNAEVITCPSEIGFGFGAMTKFTEDMRLVYRMVKEFDKDYYGYLVPTTEDTEPPDSAA